MMRRLTRVCFVAAAAFAVTACETEQPLEPEVPISEDLDLHYDRIFGKGFRTEQGAQARIVDGVRGRVIPLMTVGDIMPGSDEPLVPLPDGMGAFSRGYRHGINIFMNHELDEDGVETLDGTFAFPNSRVSRFVLTRDFRIRNHEYVIDGSEGYTRLCSAEWVDREDGFEGGYFFTGEETSDGLQLAIDANNNVIETPHIGYYAHENQISVPGFRYHSVILNFDDNGGSGDVPGVSANAASRSELYMYAGATSQDVLNGNGQLYVYASDDVTHPGQLTASQTIDGHWIPIPADVAAGPAADLEAWVDDAGAFPFVRLEDGFYDKREPNRYGHGWWRSRHSKPTAYFFDTGRGGLTENGVPWDPWGSIYRIDFNDSRDPAAGAKLTLLARSTGPADGWASPDNGDMNDEGEIMVQEDPANGPWERRPAIYRLRVDRRGYLIDPAGTKVVEVIDPDDPGNPDEWAWETSGIIDASEWLGRGSWIFNVQAHRKTVPSLNLTAENGQILILELSDRKHHRW